MPLRQFKLSAKRHEPGRLSERKFQDDYHHQLIGGPAWALLAPHRRHHHLHEHRHHGTTSMRIGFGKHNAANGKEVRLGAGSCETTRHAAHIAAASHRSPPGAGRLSGSRLRRWSGLKSRDAVSAGQPLVGENRCSALCLFSFVWHNKHGSAGKQEAQGLWSLLSGRNRLSSESLLWRALEPRPLLRLGRRSHKINNPLERATRALCQSISFIISLCLARAGPVGWPAGCLLVRATGWRPSADTI